MHGAFGEQRQDGGANVAALAATAAAPTTSVVTESALESESGAETPSEPSRATWPESSGAETAAGEWSATATPVTPSFAAEVRPGIGALVAVEAETEPDVLVGPELFGPVFMESHVFS